MKKGYIRNLTFSFFALILLVSNLQAQDVDLIPKQNVLKLDIAWIISETFYFSYERILNEEASIQLGFMAGNGRGIASLSYRYYLAETPAPKGAFLAPIAGIGAGDGMVFGAGLMVGSQAYFKQKITLDAFIGPIYGRTDTESGFTIFAGINVGIAF